MSGTRRRRKATGKSTTCRLRKRRGVFSNPLSLTFPDPDPSAGEEREITIGHTTREQVIFVSHCQRGKRLRIISARNATRGERKQYEEGIGKRSE